jgi:hypothetical protein
VCRSPKYVFTAHLRSWACLRKSTHAQIAPQAGASAQLPESRFRAFLSAERLSAKLMQSEALLILQGLTVALARKTDTHLDCLGANFGAPT